LCDACYIEHTFIFIVICVPNSLLMKNFVKKLYALPYLKGFKELICIGSENIVLNSCLTSSVSIVCLLSSAILVVSYWKSLFEQILPNSVKVLLFTEQLLMVDML
jgi:hypothetical protein